MVEGMSPAFCEGRYCWFGRAFCDGEGVFTRGGCGLGVFMRGVVMRGARMPPMAASAGVDRHAAEIVSSPAAATAGQAYALALAHRAPPFICLPLYANA